jgi:hypothetical protein
VASDQPWRVFAFLASSRGEADFDPCQLAAVRDASPPRSAFARFRFSPDVIVLAVRWYLRFGLSSTPWLACGVPKRCRGV